MSKTYKGTYTPANPEKYLGKTLPYARSSWELTFMRWCDANPAILEWASEEIKIPYFNPVSKKQTMYVPDFYIKYVDKHNVVHTEVIEIKPKKETFLEHAKSKKDKYRLAINAAKWQAASAFCEKYGMKFRVLNESHLFVNKK